MGAGVVVAYLTLDTTRLGTWDLDPLAIYERLKERVVHVHLSNHNGQEHQLLRLFVLYVPLVFAGSALFGLQGIFGAAASANDVAGIAAYLWLRRILAGESLRWKAAAVGEVGGKAAAVGE